MTKEEVQQKYQRINKMATRYDRVITAVLLFSMLGAGTWIAKSPGMAIVLGLLIYVVSTIATHRVNRWAKTAYAQVEQDKLKDLR